MPRGKPLLYLSDELKKRLAKAKYYEGILPFPKYEIRGKQWTLPEFVREAGATDPQWSNVFNVICGDLETTRKYGFDEIGTSNFWMDFESVLVDIEMRMRLSFQAEQNSRDTETDFSARSK